MACQYCMHVEKPTRHYESMQSTKEEIIKYNTPKGFVNTEGHDYYKELKKYKSKLLKDRTWWPCWNCNGTGKVRDPNECDSVEGYKMASWYPCKLCNGTGQIPRKEFKALCQVQIDKYKKELNAYNYLIKVEKQALKKLNNEEIKVLKRLGLR